MATSRVLSQALRHVASGVMTRNVISADDVGSALRWEAPTVGESGAMPGKPQAQGSKSRSEDVTETPPIPTAQQIREIQRQAREEGLEQGREEGRKHGLASVKAEAESLRKVLASLVPSVQTLDSALEADLLELISTVARQLVRRELRTDPGQIVAVVREGLAVLPSTDRTIRLHLHPEDARIVRDALHLSDLEQPWKVIEDPTLSRGGSRLETEASRVDATLETRLNTLIAELWGDERRSDDDSQDDGEAGE